VFYCIGSHGIVYFINIHLFILRKIVSCHVCEKLALDIVFFTSVVINGWQAKGSLGKAILNPGDKE